MRQNCSALTLASLSGEGSGEGRRGKVFAVCRLQAPSHQHSPFHWPYPI